MTPICTYDNVSLVKWLGRADRACVPSVPVHWCSDPIKVAVLEHAFSHPEATLSMTDAWFRSVQDAIYRHDDCMIRWECCAPGYSKYLATQKAPFQKAWREFTLDDPRFWDRTIPDENGCTRLLLRPWVEPRRYEGWPVEFRVFCQEGKIIGVSNYYPQVTLPENVAIGTLVGVARTYARRILDLFDTPRDCTMDFLSLPLQPGEQLTSEKHLLFLEGGPPHRKEGGAHACCFPVGQVQGVAYGPPKGVVQC